MTRTDNKLTLVKVHFSMKAYKNKQKKNLEQLSTSAIDFFSFCRKL